MLSKLTDFFRLQYIRIRHGEEGQTLVEYALILALLILLAVVSFPAIGSRLAEIFSQTYSRLTSTTTG